ncbi:hypothetical protein [Roseovarius sp.]|uniref:hypothetical protein n=1 Tax=Roseovarius sp. TaxID=1486281 RepID=UPI003565FE27
MGATPINQGLDSEMFDRSDFPYYETFVREAIQNSLDARLDPTKSVCVNFTFHSEGIGPRRAFLEQVIEHRKKAELDIPPEWDNGNVRWLLVEDFNSKGLSGNLASRTSDFWNYWLNFGLSNKGGEGRGGRGIGRVTFLIASRLQSVIGYTRRSKDGTSAICGMAVLRPQEDGHHLKSTHAYLAEGENGNIYTLHNSPEFHTRMRKAFAFTGYDGEHQSGLGLAILYPHAELKADGILAAAIENFAPAIMNESLVLNVDGRVLDSSSIEEIALEVAEHLNDEAVRSDVARYLDLVRLAQHEASPHTIKLPNAQKSDFEPLRTTSAIKALQKKIADEQDIVLEVVFPLVRKGVTKDVSVRAVVGAAASGKRPIDRLFREGMSLPDVRAKSPGELDLVMLVEEGQLATYLNFCEGKAHLDLLESKDVLQKLEDHGFGGSRIKRLVKNLPTELRLLLTPDVTAPDSHVFDSYFSKPSDMPGKRKKPKKPDDPPPPPPPPKPPVFRVETLDDGLRIKANPDFTDWPVNVTVGLAYADGSRRPSWSPFDFKFEDLSMDHSDCELTTDKNKVKAVNCGPDTEIKITGFDTNRELDTSIRPWRNA